jgi:hypothetical protein
MPSRDAIRTAIPTRSRGAEDSNPRRPEDYLCHTLSTYTGPAEYLLATSTFQHDEVRVTLRALEDVGPP